MQCVQMVYTTTQILWEHVAYAHTASTLDGHKAFTSGAYTYNMHIWCIHIGAIQVLPNADGGGFTFSGKKHYECVRFKVISITKRWVGVQFPGKKCYATLEWPHTTCTGGESTYNLYMRFIHIHNVQEVQTHSMCIICTGCAQTYMYRWCIHMSTECTGGAYTCLQNVQVVHTHVYRMYRWCIHMSTECTGGAYTCLQNVQVVHTNVYRMYRWCILGLERIHQVMNTIRIANIGWRIRICIRKYTFFSEAIILLDSVPSFTL